MRWKTRAAAIASTAALLVTAAPAMSAAQEPPPTSTFTYTSNMHPLGFSARENTASPFTANSDLAFWGRPHTTGTTTDSASSTSPSRARPWPL